MNLVVIWRVPFDSVEASDECALLRNFLRNGRVRG